MLALYQESLLFGMALVWWTPVVHYGEIQNSDYAGISGVPVLQSSVAPVMHTTKEVSVTWRDVSGTGHQ